MELLRSEKRIFTCPIKVEGRREMGINFKRKRTYPDERNTKYYNLIKHCFLEHYTATPLDKRSISAKIDVIVEPPQSYSEKKRQKMIGEPLIVKPDIDNIQKAIFDALNKIAYYDDNQIYEVHIVKRYGGADNILIELNYENW
ncbi:MAG: RusA family crossover junction endodeoxyribonuclease [Halanaerobiales bacterium]|nr:RusA family crossover junction endodeoxyribonuclease [Halanaerobiales bacterium]